MDILLFWHCFWHSCAFLKSSQSYPWGSQTDQPELEKGMTSETIDRIFRLPKVLEITGLTRSTLYRKIERGEFPRQIKLSERCAGWRESAIREWSKNPIFYSVNDMGQ